MILDSIEIKGFKSFPDKTKLSFRGGITAVVGPNGSGKSNISDAVRWVLGEQSTKSLRSGKMEDVIFGGTAQRKAAGVAEVTLVIDNKDRSLSFDSDMVNVTRRYYRSGESEYKLNGATVRLKDIHELFMDTGLGRDGYSMIGQGRIDDIVSSKSQQRREIFEEAAGITKFRYRKSEAEKRLLSAEENLLRLRDIYSELESRIGPLKEQSEKAGRFLELSEEKKGLEIGLWLDMLDKSQQTVSEQENKINIARAMFEQLERELSDTEEQIEQHMQASQQAAAKIDEVRREISSLEEEMVRAEGDRAIKQNTIYHNNAVADRLRSDIETLTGNRADIEARIAGKQRQAEQCATAVKGKYEELDGLNTQLSELLEQSSGFSEKIDTINARLNELSSQQSDNKVLFATSQSAVLEIETRMADLNAAMEELTQRSESLLSEKSELDSDLGACEEKITECTNSLKGYEMMLDIKEKSAAKIKDRMDDLSSQISEKERRAKILTDLENNMEGFYNSVKLIMSEKHTLPGIHGPVSRLVAVPQEYALAVETALGGAMQNIIVEDETAAKRAIAFLKEQRGGRATFMPLTSVRGGKMQEPAERTMSGYIGVADTLVSADGKYRNIVEYLLGRTVVADTLDNASAIAKRAGYKYRVVTLDGQQINSGGTYTGGSMSKTAGLLARKKNIDDLLKSAAELKGELSEIEGEYNAAVEAASAVKADIIAAQSVRKTAEEDKIRVLVELKRVSEQYELAKASLESAKREGGQLDARMEKCRANIAESSEKTEAVELEMACLNSELASLTGGKDDLKERRSVLSEKISSVRLEIVASEKDAESLVQEIDELNVRLTDSHNRKQQLLDEIEDLDQQSAALMEEIEVSKLNTESLREKSEALKSDIENLYRRRDMEEKQAGELRGAERDKISEKERAASEIIRLTERRDALIKEYDDIIARLYDEYELTKSEAEQMGIKLEDTSAARRRLNEIKSKIKALGVVNVAAIEEYKEIKERYDFLTGQISDVEKSKGELIKLISSLTKQMREIFTERFALINDNFKEVFTELFGGGSANLSLTDPDDVLQSGIDIIVQPPGKNISIIEQLSGGEKALIAISIYFAIMKVNPPPFCMLDEVEAALDEVNVTRFAEYLRRMCSGTQFIVISHRRGTMEEADMLYGVTMQEKGVSKLLQIDISEVEHSLKATV